MNFLNLITFLLVLLKCLSCQPLSLHGSVYDSDSELDLLEAAVEREEKLLSEEIETIIRNTLPQLPPGKAYDSDRLLFRKFLQQSDNLQTARGDRLSNEFEYSKTFANIVQTYKETTGGSSSVEHQNVVRLLNDFGFKNFINRLESFNKRMF
ncbi:uncharacterized protein [Musca autumnalis]|uniref:uncharacterized protein n=1 Tax=Musca autumnalis TaxID=221902 RepID=UPI003CF74321